MHNCTSNSHDMWGVFAARHINWLNDLRLARQQLNHGIGNSSTMALFPQLSSSKPFKPSCVPKLFRFGSRKAGAGHKLHSGRSGTQSHILKAVSFSLVQLLNKFLKDSRLGV